MTIEYLATNINSLLMLVDKIQPENVLEIGIGIGRCLRQAIWLKDRRTRWSRGVWSRQKPQDWDR